jgi:hypothetical protein
MPIAQHFAIDFIADFPPQAVLCHYIPGLISELVPGPEPE